MATKNQGMRAEWKATSEDAAKPHCGNYPLMTLDVLEDELADTVTAVVSTKLSIGLLGSEDQRVRIVVTAPYEKGRGGAATLAAVHRAIAERYESDIMLLDAWKLAHAGDDAAEEDDEEEIDGGEVSEETPKPCA